MAYYFILFFVLSPHLFSQFTANSSSIFYLNSTLPSTWYNNNSNSDTISFDNNSQSKLRTVLSIKKNNLGFACGFYCIDTCTYYLFSIIVIGGGGPGLVWSANRGRPVQENASLQLTRGGDLELRDADGTMVWSTNTSNNSVLGMNMTETGNLVIFNNLEDIVWQSYDHPTDTLLVGQRLYETQKLISSSSSSNFSTGLYYAMFTTASGFAAYTEVGNGQSQMYYKLAPEQSTVVQNSQTRHCRLLIRNEDNNSANSTGSSYKELLTGAFFVNWGVSQGTLRTSPLALPFDSYIEYTKLESNGSLRIYRHSNETGLTNPVDMVRQDLGECQYPRRCGLNGLCRNGQCSCPIGVDRIPYFKENPVQTSGFGGCSRVTPLSCQSLTNHQLVQVSNASYFDIIDSESAVINISDIDRCKEACRQTCSCQAAFFRYQNNATDGYCYNPSEVLTIREGQIPNFNFSSVAYIKVDRLSGSNPPPKGPKPSNRLAIIAGSSAGFLILCLFFIGIFMKKCGKTKNEEEWDEGYISKVPGMPVSFSYEELRLATEDFKERLGGGGFGSVFKGKLKDETVVAVKRLDKMGQGVREFLAEVETIGSLHHFNLVRLIGFCAEKSCRLLVYEYLSNGSLEKWIFHREEENFLNWHTRKEIILGIAKGLAYLHEECRQRIIHLDIKPQNILLDENFNAKISDFGLSKLVDRDESQVLTTLRGTPGYIAPECGKSNITVKVDIYSFGIVLLEIVSGRRNLDRYRSETSKHLLEKLQKKAKENRLIDIVEDLDEELQDFVEEAVRVIRIGVWCLQNEPTQRPLMSTVVKVLEGVMEVPLDINYNFVHAMGSSTPAANDHVFSADPQASVLSNPR